MGVVLKEEFNAVGRAKKGKIVRKGDYKGQSPGKLNLSIKLVNGTLTVLVKSAKGLFGKRSQDPYAFCYLLEGERTWFEEGNEKTEKKDKTLTPEWNHQFQFRGVSLVDLVKKSLVIAIWDEDSKSRDDYMAGIRISLQEVMFFDEMISDVTLELQHQLDDGHPAEPEGYQWWRTFFGYVKREGSWDLKTCNNHLINFIERARVLAEAIEVKAMYPDNLNNESSVSFTANKMIGEEIEKMRIAIAERRKFLAEKRSIRDRLKSENTSNSRSYLQYKAELQELCSTKCGIVETGTMMQVQSIRVPDFEIAGMDYIRLGDNSKYEDFIKRIIAIWTEYEKKMKLELSKVRVSYSETYQVFISGMRNSADEIMRLYEDIIRERTAKNPDYRNGLLSLETKRRYSERMEILTADLAALDRAIRDLLDRLGRLEGEWLPQMNAADADLDALKAKLRELLSKMVAYAESKYSVTNEVAIYEKLLSFEDHRIRSSSKQRTVSVRSNTNRTSDMMSVHNSQGHGYKTPEMSPSVGGNTTRDSAFSTASESTITRSHRSSSRSSTNTITNRQGSRDNFLQDLEDQL